MLPFVSPKNGDPTDTVDIGAKIKNSAPSLNSGSESKKTLGERVGGVLKKTALAGVVGSLGSSDLSFRGEKSKKIGSDGKLLDQTEGSGDVSELMTPLNDIKEVLMSMSKSVKSILDSIRGVPNQKFPANDNSRVGIQTGGKRNSGILSFINSVSQPANGSTVSNGKQDYDEVASASGESPTSAYRQNEKQEDTSPSEVTISEFGPSAIKQLSDIMSSIGEKLGGKSDSGLGIPPIIPPIKNPFKNLFGGKPKGAGGQVKGGGGPGKITRDPKTGRFMKAEAGTLKSVEGAAVKTASRSSGLMKLGGKALGVAAIPVMAGLDYMGRKKEGQTEKQASIGTAAGATGALAGGIAGAQGGALVGGGIGAAFGGVGAAPGALIGGAVGGIGGAIAGSELGGWVADKFTGVGKIQEKENTALVQTKDIVSLEKTRNQKEKNSKTAAPAPTIISAPTSTSIVNQSTSNMIGANDDTRGSRGSLDLRKY